MLRILRNTRAQSTAEYAVVIALVIGAAIAMQTYVKRSMQGQIKFAVDKLKSENEGAIGQYEPYYLQSSYEVATSAYKDTEEKKVGGEIVRTTGAGTPKTTTRTGKQIILDVKQKGTEDDAGGTEGQTP